MRGTRLTLPNDTSMYYETTALSGNAILYRKNIVNQPFPERYFAYAEDVFFNLFLLISGHKMAFCPQSICHHYGSGSFGKKPSDFKLFHGNRNQIVNFFIFYQPTTILKLFPLFLLGQLGHLFINVPFKRLKAKLKARWRIFKHWHKVKALTYEVQKHKKLTDKQLLSLLSKDISSPEGNHGKFSSVQKKMIISVNKISHWYCKTILNI
jgi:GT2 family glycosyltransferase